MRSASAMIIYLRLPPHAALARTGTDDDIPLPYAFVARNKLQQTGVASLREIEPELASASTVVLLIAASDVTLLRVAVPPLPAHRLPQVLPALVEDRLIGDPAACVIVAGAEDAGQRWVAVAARDGLLYWTTRLRTLGVHRFRALPLQLCLPLPASGFTAAVMAGSEGAELVIRYGIHEGLGVPLTDAGDVTLPDQVLQALVTLAGERPVTLWLPPDYVGDFESTWTSGRHRINLTALHALHWTTLIDMSGQAGPDLIPALNEPETVRLRWQSWRWPLRLAVMLVVINILALLGDGWRLQREAEDWRIAMADTYRRAFPGDTLMTDPITQVKQKIIQARRQAGEPVPGDFLALAAGFGDAWTELQANDESGTPAIAGLAYRDQVLEVRFKPGAKPSINVAQKIFSVRALQVSEFTDTPTNQTAPSGRVWQVRSAR